MIIGAHAIVFSTKPDADVAFMRDVLKLGHVDAGGGFLVFGLPPAEVAVHEGEKNDVHELYLMCDDVNALVDEMTMHGIPCGIVEDRGWGVVTQMTLPGGGKLSVYEPRHPRPKAAAAAAAAPVKKAKKKSAKRAAKPVAKTPVKKAAKKAAKKAPRRRR